VKIDRFIHIDGSNSFIAPVGGIDPISEDHLSTKGHVTTISGILQTQHDNHIINTDIHFPWEDVEDKVGTASGTLQNEINIHTGNTDIHFPWEDVTDLTDTISGTLQTQIDYIGTRKRILSFAIRESSKDYFETSDTNWVVALSIPYPGTDLFASEEFMIIGSRDNTTGIANCRLYDYTNSNEVCSIDWIPSTKNLYTTTSFINMPTGSAILEVQIKKDSPSASKARIHSCVLR